MNQINDAPEPLSQSLAKEPIENEDLSEETIASIERGRLCFERGEFTSHAEMLREFARQGTNALSVRKSVGRAPHGD